jgi:hypothetical protein
MTASEALPRPGDVSLPATAQSQVRLPPVRALCLRVVVTTSDHLEQRRQQSAHNRVGIAQFLARDTLRLPVLAGLVRSWTALPAIFCPFAGPLLIPLPGFEPVRTRLSLTRRGRVASAETLANRVKARSFSAVRFSYDRRTPAARRPQPPTPETTAARAKSRAMAPDGRPTSCRAPHD